MGWRRRRAASWWRPATWQWRPRRRSLPLRGFGWASSAPRPSVAVSRNLSRKRAFEVLFTGDFIDAAMAVQEGLINYAVPADQLDATVQRLVDAIVSKSPVAVATGKGMFYNQLEMNMADAYVYAAEVMACNMMAADAQEGIDAFIEKRQPVWKGR